MSFVSALPIIWLTVILVAIFVEAASEKLVAVWLAPSAATAFVCGLFNMSPKEQIAIFIILGVSLIAASQSVCAAIKRSCKHNNRDRDIE